MGQNPMLPFCALCTCLFMAAPAACQEAKPVKRQQEVLQLEFEYLEHQAGELLEAIESFVAYCERRLPGVSFWLNGGYRYANPEIGRMNRGIIVGNWVERIMLPAMLSFAEKYPENKVAMDAIGVILRSDSLQSIDTCLDDRTVERLGAILLDYHANEELTGVLCFLLVNGTGNRSATKLFKALIGKTTNPDVRNITTLALADLLRKKSYETNLPEIERKKFQKEAEGLYVKAIAESANDRRSVQLANASLYDMRELAIGKRLPEITGKDSNGTEFKLSDYRGKVVVLHEWSPLSWSWAFAHTRKLRLVRAFENSPVAIIGLAVSNVSPAELKKMETAGEINWRSFAGVSLNPDRSVVKHGQGGLHRGISNLLVLDRQGIIRAKDCRDDRLEIEIRKLLAEK